MNADATQSYVCDTEPDATPITTLRTNGSYHDQNKYDSISINLTDDFVDVKHCIKI